MLTEKQIQEKINSPDQKYDGPELRRGRGQRPSLKRLDFVPCLNKHKNEDFPLAKVAKELEISRKTAGEWYDLMRADKLFERF